MNKKNILTWVLFFLVFFAISQFFQKKNVELPEKITKSAIYVEVADSEYSVGEEVAVKIFNNTPDEIKIPSNCPKNPLKVSFFKDGKFEDINAENAVKCDGSETITLKPNAETKISYAFWNHALFGNTGKYQVSVELKNGTTTGIFSSDEFQVVPAGFFRKTFRTFFYQPIYNVLILFINIAPSKDLGLAIILLTLLVRLILLVPSQRAMASQRRMQDLQPKLAHIKKKYAGNQEKIAQETMALWKENKVNPFGSCLPLIVQFPVLIALFYVIQNGLNPDNVYLLYSPFRFFHLTNIHTNFLGILELTKVNAYVLPLIIGALQFLQMKLAMAKKKAKDENAENKDENKASEMEMANKTMIYIMPVMIAVFTASVPAGVGLYWGVSTLFALGQQVVVNRKSIVKS